jgi:predicted phosphodiesterase
MAIKQDRLGPGPASSPMAFLSDVHGNLPALEAVLKELRARAITDIYVAGDLLLGGEQPLEVWQRLQGIGARCIRGASDAALATVDPQRLRPVTAEEAAMAARFSNTRGALGELILRRLAALPERLRVAMLDGRELLVVHGSPKDPLESISHEIDDEELRELLADDAANIVICGGTHVPFSRSIDEVQVLNVGSVGDAPGGGIAHFTIVSPSPSGATIEQTWTEY